MGGRILNKKLKITRVKEMTTYYIKIIDKNGKPIGSRLTHIFRRFLNYLQACQNELGGIYIKFTYGMAIDSDGKMTRFINEGEYRSKKAALLAINAFHEVEGMWK